VNIMPQTVEKMVIKHHIVHNMKVLTDKIPYFTFSAAGYQLVSQPLGKRDAFMLSGMSISIEDSV
jgi:hypothetical protein